MSSFLQGIMLRAHVTTSTSCTEIDDMSEEQKRPAFDLRGLKRDEKVFSTGEVSITKFIPRRAKGIVVTDLQKCQNMCDGKLRPCYSIGVKHISDH